METNNIKMTPKEKAEELIELFTFSCKECDNAKYCALICADQCMVIMMDEYFEDSEAVQYWKQVKQELEKL